MCSLNDCRYNDDDDKMSNNAKDLVMNATQCRKCRFEDVDVLLVGQSGYCKTCFLTVINHKFRAALGKSKIIRQGDSILIDHSGELNSTVLLHLIKAGMSESTHKKLIFKPMVLYIDDSVVMGRTNEEKSALQHKIAEEIKNSGFNGYVVSLSQVLNKEDILNIIPIDQQQMSIENDEQLRAILANLSDETSRTDLLSQLRRRLLISAAQKLNCNKVFIADSVMDIATKALGDICLGRGAQVGALASFCDARCTNIKILKPMRDFTQQELLYYSKYHKIEPVKLRESIDTMPATSIQTLACNFTMNLDSQFSGTVCTIFRTAEKVSAKFNEQQDVENNCVMCDTRLDFASFSDEVSAMRAIAVSKQISSICGDTESLPTNKENETSHYMRSQLNNKICSNGDCDCKKNKENQLTDEDIWKCLCYGCRQIFRNLEILNTLPASVILKVQQRIALKSMREEINDFLL